VQAVVYASVLNQVLRAEDMRKKARHVKTMVVEAR
jgi:hypothetical protein